MNKLANITLISCLLSCTPKFNISILEIPQSIPGNISFIPGKKYLLKDCLHGDFIATKTIHGIAVSYFNHKGLLYQQALFGLENTNKDYIAQSVEIDFNSDGLRDILFQANEDLQLKIITPDYQRMIEYLK